MFTFPSNQQTVLHGGCTILHSYHQCRSNLISPHPYQCLLFSFFKIICILLGVRWYLMVSICIFLLAVDVKHVFMCLLSVYLLWRNVY